MTYDDEGNAGADAPMIAVGTEFAIQPSEETRRGLAAHYGARAAAALRRGEPRNAMAFARAAAHHGLEAVGRVLMARAGGRSGNVGQTLDGECACELL